MKRSKLTHKLAALATVAAGMGAAPAFAGTLQVGNIVNNVAESANAIPRFLGLLGYIGGSGLAMAGVLKLKQHVDNPGQTPMKDGIGRLAAGGLLFCLPILTNAIQGSIANGDANGANTTQMIITSTTGFTG